MAIQIASSRDYYSQYNTHGPILAEFITRSSARTLKDLNIQEAERTTKYARNDLIEEIQTTLKILEQERYLKFKSSQKMPQRLSLISRFFEWLDGTKRERQLGHEYSKAHDYGTETMITNTKVKFIGKLLSDYEKNVAHYLSLVRDAQAHHIHTTSGWTWWR